MNKHWSERVKDSLMDTAKFMADYGKQFGLTAIGTMGVAAATAASMAMNTDHTLVSDQMGHLAAGLGMAGAVTGGYITMASIICEKIVDKENLSQNYARNRLTDLMEKMTGRDLDDPKKAISEVASDP